MNLNFVPYLKLCSIENLLRQMISSKNDRPTRESTRVRVTVGPHVHVGIPLKVEDVGGEKILALYNQDGGTHSLEALTLLSVSSITSVTLVDLRSALPAITEPGDWNVEMVEAPSRLAIERRAKALTKPTTLDWAGQQEDGQARAFSQELLTGLEATLQKLDQDPAGQQTLDAITEIQMTLNPAEKLSVSRSGKLLHIRFGLNADRKEIPGQLFHLIKEVLP